MKDCTIGWVGWILLMILIVAECNLDCPQHDGCNCNEENKIICDCSKAQGAKQLDELIIPSNIELTAKVLYVFNCETVLIPNYAITNIALKRIIFSDITTLKIATLGINSLNNIELIRFKNINNLLMSNFALSYFTNVTKFEIINVKASRIPHSSFTEMTNVENFCVIDSDLGEIWPHSIKINGGNMFNITKSKFKRFKNSSIVVDNFSQFHLTDSIISTLDKNAIGIGQTGQIKISKNTLVSVGKGFIFVSKAAEVLISENKVWIMHNGAFENLYNISSVRIMNNNISRANSMRVDPKNLAENAELYIKNNVFECGCQLETLVISSDEDFLSDNFCLSAYTGLLLKLEKMEFVFDENGTCHNFVETEKSDDPTDVKKDEFITTSHDSPEKKIVNSSRIINEEQGDSGASGTKLDATFIIFILLTVCLINMM